MSYTAVITTKIDPQTKKEAMATADKLGMPLSVVIKAFLKQFIRTKSLTFSLLAEEPTTYLIESLKKSEEDVKSGRVVSFKTGKDALDYLDREIKNERHKQSPH